MTVIVGANGTFAQPVAATGVMLFALACSPATEIDGAGVVAWPAGPQPLGNVIERLAALRSWVVALAGGEHRSTTALTARRSRAVDGRGSPGTPRK